MQPHQRIVQIIFYQLFQTFQPVKQGIAVQVQFSGGIGDIAFIPQIYPQGS